MNDLLQIRQALNNVAARVLPRMLSQVCRDPTSEGRYGCFDRNWWHYKMRDFPSIILQQGGYALDLARELPLWPAQPDGLRALAAAACRFWNERAVRKGAFEEYYPWEQGYPPLAFSTLAVMKMVDAGVIEAAQVRDGAERARGQLLHRFEGQAANQQVAGLAALAWLRKIFPGDGADALFSRLRDRTLALQSSEGWFAEYGGPDLAYLSVTMDCLWDLFDATGDDGYVNSAARAMGFMAELVLRFGGSIGMHNSRNTDYVVPYGIARFLGRSPDERDVAQRLLTALYRDADAPHHFFQTVDDRYWCHYVGHSLFRTCRLLATESASPATTHAAPRPARSNLLPQCGYYLEAANGDSTRTLLISLKKGGILSLRDGDRFATDLGWTVESGCHQYVSHWWSDHWQWSVDHNVLRVRGHLILHREYVSTPWKHFCLRVGSYFLGRRLIRTLKSLLIFKERASRIWFDRRITISPQQITVQDEITGLPADARVVAAPRSSKRHVSSADSGHLEDLRLVEGFRCERTQQRNADRFVANTTYT